MQKGVVCVGLQEVDIDGGDPESAVDALGDPPHLGVAVPVKFFVGRHDHEEKSELVGFVDGEGYYGMGHFYLGEDGVERGDAQLVKLGA